MATQNPLGYRRRRHELSFGKTPVVNSCYGTTRKGDELYGDRYRRRIKELSSDPVASEATRRGACRLVYDRTGVRQSQYRSNDMLDSTDGLPRELRQHCNIQEASISFYDNRRILVAPSERGLRTRVHRKLGVNLQERESSSGAIRSNFQELHNDKNDHDSLIASVGAKKFSCSHSATHCSRSSCRGSTPEFTRNMFRNNKDMSGARHTSDEETPSHAISCTQTKQVTKKRKLSAEDGHQWA